MTNAVDDKSVVREYFNATGFDRWRRIYGDGEVNKVQRDIRKGHQQTIDTVMSWLEADGNLQGLAICDAGCGVGSLSIPLAQAGAVVCASDISQKMVGEAHERAIATLPSGQVPSFQTSDLESLTGKFHTVICLDVLIHYPQNKAADMISHLSSLAESRVILSFAPKTSFYSVLKKSWQLLSRSEQDNSGLSSCRKGCRPGARIPGLENRAPSHEQNSVLLFPPD